MKKWFVIDKKTQSILATYYQDEEPEISKLYDENLVYLKMVSMSSEDISEFYESRWIEAYPPIEDFIHAFISERLGDSKPIKDYISACQLVRELDPMPGGLTVFTQTKGGFWSSLKRFFNVK